MTTESGQTARRTACWIDACFDYTEGLTTPTLFRKWAAITTVAGVLERKVWTRSMGRPLYPSMYTLLVAPPSVGKNVAIDTAEYFWREVPDLKVAPNSLTKSSLLDTLGEAKRQIVNMARTPPMVEFHSLQIPCREFGVFIPEYNQDMMNHLNDLWDCGNVFEERRRSEKHRLRITNPQLTILGGTTPAFLGGFLPESAWEQGFMSRMIVVFSAEKPFTKVFSERLSETPSDLVHDLRSIGQLFGQMSWHPEAMIAIENWHALGEKPVPEHRKLQAYNGRRLVHLLKLCMVASASRSDSMKIELRDYQKALDWLIEAEQHMPEIFKSMITGADSAAIDECWYFVWTTYAKENRPVAEHRIIYFLQQRVPVYSVKSVLETMVKSNLLEEVELGDKGRWCYKPVPKQLHNPT